MELVKELHLEGRSIPLNFDYEMRPLKSALEGVRGWLTEHQRVLSLLSVVDGSSNDRYILTSSSLIYFSSKGF
jgi:hypothetical protein